MGSCISKCKPKRKSKEECSSHVQDKLVISEAPIDSLSVPVSKPLPPPSPSPTSSSCFSSNSGAISSSTSCGYSLTSSLSSSSSLSSKDRSFSNEFLCSCVRENPHVIRLDPIKGSPEKLVQNRVQVRSRKLDSPGKQIVAPTKQAVAERLVQTIPQKRVRSNSPTLTRQKSFRKEPERPSSPYVLSNRCLRSPSPSRRFNGQNCRGYLPSSQKMSFGRGLIGSKENAFDSPVRRENLRPSSPNNNLSRCHSSLRNKANTYRIGSKVDEIAVAAALSRQNMDSIPMEDIDNPLIALDCFIFL